MRTTVWTLTTDYYGLAVEVYGTADEARTAWREWAQLYYVDPLPDNDDELHTLLWEKGAYSSIEQHTLSVSPV